MTIDTTTLSYWLNWRFLICAILILAAMVVSLLLIWKYDGSSKSRSHRRENGQKKAAFLDKDDVWKTSYKAIHPNWLLAYRLIAFSLLLSLLTADVVLHGVRILYFYTQWTFTLATVYFLLGSSLSIRGCLQSCKGGSGASTDGVDTERGTYIAPVPEKSVLIVSNGLNSHGEPHDYCGLALQIVFQMTAGAVVLTDCVFWLLIYPFLTDKNYKLHFLAVCMHSVNAICLLGDVCLNRLRFPFFRIAYFVLWTCVFVIFQWILHIFVSLRYFAVGILHLPCYGMFAILIRIKTCWLSRLFHSPIEM